MNKIDQELKNFMEKKQEEQADYSDLTIFELEEIFKKKHPPRFSREELNRIWNQRIPIEPTPMGTQLFGPWGNSDLTPSE